MSIGFYKKDNNTIIYGDIVNGPDYVLQIQDKESYSYPYDGWIYAESLDDAIVMFALSATDTNTYYHVVPEDIYLATNRTDEAEFTKLVTLVQLSLSMNQVDNNTPFQIFDKDGASHTLTVERFLQVMVGYGMFCYQQRGL